MHELAYGVFVLIVCIYFTKQIVESKQYGRRLRSLRNACGDSTVREDDMIVLKVDKKTLAVVDAVNVDDDNRDQLLHLLHELETGKVVFKHMPDLVHTTHLVAIFKTETDDAFCLAIMNT